MRVRSSKPVQFGVGAGTPMVKLGRGTHDTTTTSDIPPEPALVPYMAAPVTGLSSSAIAVGGYASCAILSDHTVECWGFNYADSPTQVSGVSNVNILSDGR